MVPFENRPIVATEPLHLNQGRGLRSIRVPLVSARGSRYEIGLEHGRQVAELVQGTLDWSLDQIAANGLNHDQGLKWAGVLLEVVRAHTPELVQEIQGIADGAQLSLNEVALINTRYELMFLEEHKGEFPTSTPECTLFGAVGSRTVEGYPIIGQNVDLEPESRPYWIMLDVQPDGAPRVLTATLAGMLAQEGINNAGLALCGSMVQSRGWREGYPSRKFLRRRVLEQRSVAQAIDLIRSAPRRASSHNLMLADSSGQVVDVETTVDQVGVLEPQDGLIAHANHYLFPEFECENVQVSDHLGNTRARCSRMREQLEEAGPPLTVERLANLLRDHSGGSRAICRHAHRDEKGNETNVAVISEPAHRRMHVAFGPPCEVAFTTYTIPNS